MAFPRIPWNFPAVCWLLLAVAIAASLGLECREHQYPLHGKCCSDCAPGECPALGGKARFFLLEYLFFNGMSIFFLRKGSVEVKPCEKTSDRVCVCQAGFRPAGIPLGNECSRCPEGTFSTGRNENCQPWTNCSSFGKITLRAGTATEDALCSSPEPRSCRVPVQEEHIDGSCSLLKS
ncbi:PREDICTED: tumor necrosis factor receptor superfamily member 4 [Sturnus vulgaris]|uniref:tumor necrosis factor receptor superfamily member 4 n=1 Tax=Sturnus vulgaris TaxID=9172 RepID=UPI00071A4CAB|nr:PREDICTED: tumor necrosis factor receptor superfamily member 4 [Sturnus vulgaris]